MKLAITYVNIDTGAQHRIEDVEEEFNISSLNPPVLDVIQGVVDKYESAGLTIDQGGDDNVYELDLPDGYFTHEEPTLKAKAINLYNDVKGALRKAGY